ncbi:unnamed protein product [Victoria cruziana]
MKARYPVDFSHSPQSRQGLTMIMPWIYSFTWYQVGRTRQEKDDQPLEKSHLRAEAGDLQGEDEGVYVKLKLKLSPDQA